MGQAIIKLGEHYLVWSSVVDAPITYGLTLEELREYWREEWGNRGLEGLERDLPRVEATGTSARRYSVEEIIEGNRAGEGETRLTREQIVDYYVTRRGEGPQPVGRKR